MTNTVTYLYQVIGTPLVHDGDTATVTIDLGFNLFHTVPIRFAGINAPELATDAGKAARDALQGYVSAHPIDWTAQTYKTGREKYGRWLATLYAPDGTNMNQWMLTNGYAVVMLG